MGRTKGATAGRNEDRMRALHAAARRDGHCGKPMTIPEWETIVIAWFGMRSRQSCHDITWGMARLGMIQWEKGTTVAFLDQDPLTSNEPEGWTPDLEAVPA